MDAFQQQLRMHAYFVALQRNSGREPSDAVVGRHAEQIVSAAEQFVFRPVSIRREGARVPAAEAAGIVATGAAGYYVVAIDGLGKITGFGINPVGAVPAEPR